MLNRTYDIINRQAFMKSGKKIYVSRGMSKKEAMDFAKKWVFGKEDFNYNYMIVESQYS